MRDLVTSFDYRDYLLLLRIPEGVLRRFATDLEIRELTRKLVTDFLLATYRLFIELKDASCHPPTMRFNSPPDFDSHVLPLPKGRS